MKTPGEVLKRLGMRGILTSGPDKGGVTQLLCDVDECYCPRGRGYFEPIGRDDLGRLVDWMPTEEHWPKSQAEGGQRVKGNVWLAHRLCNRSAGLEHERRLAIARKAEWAQSHPDQFVSEFGNREAAEAQWKQASSRRLAHPTAAASLPNGGSVH
jgi:hypothetical protein